MLVLHGHLGTERLPFVPLYDRIRLVNGTTHIRGLSCVALAPGWPHASSAVLWKIIELLIDFYEKIYNRPGDMPAF